MTRGNARVRPENERKASNPPATTPSVMTDTAIAIISSSIGRR